MHTTKSNWIAPEIQEIALDEVLDVAELRIAFATTCCGTTDCDVVPIQR
jgi:hypothetical protein